MWSNSMSRRLTPYIFASVLGVVSGVYVFRPLFEGTAVAQEQRGATGTVNSPHGPQSDTTPQEAE